eukprot:2534742-Prymnesium_polylepis.1
MGLSGRSGYGMGLSGPAWRVKIHIVRRASGFLPARHRARAVTGDAAGSRSPPHRAAGRLAAPRTVGSRAVAGSGDGPAGRAVAAAE